MSSIIFDESDPKRREIYARIFYANALRNYIPSAYSECAPPGKDMIASTPPTRRRDR